MHQSPAKEPLNTRLLESPRAAAELLQAGGLVAFPTETVFGLGVDATNPQAVRRLFTAKGRPSDNPLIVHLASLDDWGLAARELSDSARLLLNAFSPGPLTVVTPKHPAICPEITAGLDSVGIRIPNCSIALEMLRLVGRPIAAPSANISGRPSCTNWQSAMEDLAGRIDGILKGTVSQFGIESTVVDCCGDRPILLRPGAISLEQLQAIVPTTVALQGDQIRHANSPGLRHPHYQAKAPAYLFESESELADLLQATKGPLAIATLGSLALRESEERAVLLREFSTVEQYAKHFYEFLRTADRQGATAILLALAPATGIGHALRDRQRRAAESVH